MYVYCNINARSYSYCCNGTGVLLILNVCLQLLVSSTQWTCVILSSLACPALQYFTTLSHKRHDFRKESYRTQNVFWFSLQILSEIFLVMKNSASYYKCTRVGTLIVATIYLQLMQNRYMFRSFTVLQCSHHHCLQPVASDVEVVGYL